MPDRLSSLDVSFLYLEEPTTPMHVGSVGIFDPTARPAARDGEGADDDQRLDYETLLAVVRARLAYVPRYRQRVRPVPGNLANPVWVDDEKFDLTYHVRRSALPRPGTIERLCELVARVMSQPLDRNRPLWEMYFVEGLVGGRVAVISKTHQAVVDGVSAVDIGQVVLDSTPEPIEAPASGWQPAGEPSTLELVAGAVAEAVRRPSALVDAARSTLSDARITAGRVWEVAGEATTGLARALRIAARPAPGSPLNVPIGGQRRFSTVDTRLDDYRTVRARLGGTVNDVVLATIAGALRTWLFTRGVHVHSATSVRALVPMSVHDAAEPRGVGSRVAEWIVDLPVGEPSPAMRLHQVSYAMKAHAETGRATGARAMVGMTGFAPPTLHAMGARLAGSLTRRAFNLVVTNVPGPQEPLYLAGTPMIATYPFVPLAKDQALAIGLTSYHGSVCFGLDADRDAMPDVDVLASAIPDALDELLHAASEPSAADPTPQSSRRSRGRESAPKPPSNSRASTRTDARTNARANQSPRSDSRSSSRSNRRRTSS